MVNQEHFEILKKVFEFFDPSLRKWLLKWELNRLLRILKKGVDFWNKWRENNPNIKPYLCGSKLNGADLRGANLSYTNLIEANLSGANLCGANLCHALLLKAELGGANLSKANLNKAALAGAHLSGANLSGANLCGAVLITVHLSRTNLCGADITGAKLYATARDDWKIEGIKCDYIYLGRETKERTPKDRDFRPGEFEELYKQLPTIEYYFENGFTPIDAIIMDKVVQAINEKHPEFELKLDSLHSRGQPHAVFTVIHKDYADEAIRQITFDYEMKIRGIEAERNLLERFYKEAIDRPQMFINALQIGNFIRGDVIDSMLVAGDGNKVTHTQNNQIGVIGDNAKIEDGIHFGNKS